MTQELMQDFQISASGLGQLSALYFYSYPVPNHCNEAGEATPDLE